jgi:drug/metabolite transporter (DMT)-like permease
VGMGMVAFQLISVGVASTLMATVPVIILAPAALFLKEKITFREIIGAFIAVAGVLVFFIA